MFNLSNSLSLLRGPLALLFLSESTTLRVFAVLLAMVTDFIDGYLARRSKSTSKIGAALDPIMDKFFVFFVLSVFLVENKLDLWQLLLMASRDVSLCFFALYLALKKNWKDFQPRSVRWGKVTTVMQFGVILSLTFNLALPSFIYWLFVAVGLLVLGELLLASKQMT